MGQLIQKLDRVPPWVCRVLARHRRRPLTSEEIARRSGLTPSWVNRLSRKTTWAGVSVASADAFLAGCGVDPFRMKRHWSYLKRAKLRAGGLAHTHGGNAYYFRRLFNHVAKLKAA